MSFPNHNNELDDALNDAFGPPPEADFEAWRQRHPDALAHLKPERLAALAKRRRRMNRVLKIAAIAAVIIVVIGVSTWVSPNKKSGGVAFADVIQHIIQAQTATFEMTVQGEGIPQQSFQVMRLEPGRGRTIFPGGETVMVTKKGAGKVLMLNLKEKKATLLERDETENSNPQQNSFEALKDLCGRAEEVLGEKEINGQIATGYLVRKDNIDWEIWADPQTGLPIRVELSTGPLYGNMPIVMSNFEFNVELDESLFSLEPPEGFKIETKQIRTDLNEQDLIESLRIYADIMDGELFPSLDMMTIVKRLAPRKKRPGEDQLDEAARRAQTEKIMYGLVFVQKLPKDSDWHYEGADVKFGDADTPIFWYKPADSETYRVIYGDLHVADVAPNDLPGNP